MSNLAEIEPVNGTVAERIKDDSVEVLNILIARKSKQIWDYFPITERKQILSSIASAVAQIAVTLNLAKVEMASSSNGSVVFQTRKVDQPSPTGAIEFEFIGELNITIPFITELKSVGTSRVESVYATAVLVKNLFPYLSFDYPINSHIFAVAIEGRKELPSKIRYV